MERGKSCRSFHAKECLQKKGLFLGKDADGAQGKRLYHRGIDSSVSDFRREWQGAYVEIPAVGKALSGFKSKGEEGVPAYFFVTFMEMVLGCDIFIEGGKRRRRRRWIGIMLYHAHDWHV